MKKSKVHQREIDLMRRIEAAGIPIVTETPKEAPQVLIRQDFDAYESMVFDLKNGETGLILPLRITPNIPLFVFSGFDIYLDRWPNVWFRPVEENWKGEWPHYQFYGRSELKFDRSETMNRFIVEQKEVRRGQVLRGLLLALSYDPMPEDIGFGEILRGSMKILDQFGHEHFEKIRVRSNRGSGRKPEPKGLETGTLDVSGF